MTRRKILLISIPLVILLIGFGGYLFISSEYFLVNIVQGPLIKALEDQINDDYAIHIEGLRGNVLTSIDVQDFSIQRKTPEKPPILSTKRITLKYNFFGLLRRKLLVTALVIDSPKIEVQRNSDGQFNLTELLQKAPQDSESNNTFAFAVSNVQINNGEIHFTDTQQKIDLSLPNINFKLEGELENWDRSGTVSISQGSFTLNGAEFPIERLKDVKFAISAKSGELKPLQLKLGNSVLDVKEFKRNWDNGVWNTHLELAINAEDVQNILNTKTQLEGTSKVVLDLNGTDSTLSGRLTVQSDTISIKPILDSSTQTTDSNDRQIDITELTIDTSLDLADNPKATLDKFSLQIADGVFTGKGSATFDNTVEGNLLTRLQHLVNHPITYDSNWQVSELQLKSLMSMFLELPTQFQQIQSGSLSGRADIKGNTNGDIYIDSGLELSETSMLVKGEAKPILLNASTLKCKIISEKDNRSTVTADGVFDDAKVDIKGNLEELDVIINNYDFGKLCKIFNTVPFGGIGSITAEIKKDGTATGYVEIPNAEYNVSTEMISLGRLTGNFRYSDQIVLVENAQLVKEGVNGNTRVSIQGDVGIGAELPANFVIVAEPLVLDSDYNKLFFQQELPIEGVINGELKLYGFLINHLDGKGIFTVDSGNAWNINLDPLTLQLEVDDYSLTIPKCMITTRGQEVSFNAFVSNEGEFDFKLKNPDGKPIQLAEVALAAEMTDFPLDGKLDVNVNSYQKKQEDFVFEVDFDFSNLTFDNNPLSDATLFASLVKENQQTGESAFFEFSGEAFEGTCKIEGKIINTEDNPYQFTLKCKEMSATPILRILDKRLEDISGTADSDVIVEGTLTELTSEPEDPSAKRIHPYDVYIDINHTQLQYNSVQFKNQKPIRINLINDILTIADSSLSVTGQNSSFVNLTGNFDLKNERINISANSDENFLLEPFGAAFDVPITGNGFYRIEINGTPTDPNVEFGWRVPSLEVNTGVGNINISDANGKLTFHNNIVSIEPFTMQVMDNTLQVGGTITVNQDELNDSKLDIDIKGDNLDLAKFSDFIEKSLPVEKLNLKKTDDATLIHGNLNVNANLGGSITETSININVHSTDNKPIKIGEFVEPIKLEELHTVTTVSQQSVHIHEFVTNGQIGQGGFQINGNTLFSSKNRDEMKFDMGVSFQKLQVSNFISFFHHNPSLITGILSGSVELTGSGFTSDLFSAICKIDDLNLNTHNYNISNSSQIALKINNGVVDSYLPIQITSPTIESKVDTRIDGTLSSPILSVQLQGTLNPSTQSETDLPLQLQGKIGYVDSQMTVGITFTDNGDDISLNGTIPINLAISDESISERFSDVPINLLLSGDELPLTFFPSLNHFFSETEGVSDFNVKLQGTYPKFYLDGTVNIFSPHLRLKNFNQPFRNVNIQLNAGKDEFGEDVIELTKFQFDLEEGEVKLQQLQKSRLILDGLTPKRFELNGLMLNEYPLGSMLKQSIPDEILGDLDGDVTATLRKLIIPLDSFFDNGGDLPIPLIQEQISFDTLTQIATVDIMIDSISLGFSALDQSFNFVNPLPIPITIDKGEFTVIELRLENTEQILTSETNIPTVFSSFGRWNMRGDMRLNLKMSNFDVSVLDPLFSEFNLDTYKLKGMISTTINLMGTYAQPDISVRFDGNDLTLNQAVLEEFSGEIQYSSNDKQWSISENQPAILRSGSNQLTITGSVPYLISFSDLKFEPILRPLEIKSTLKIDDLGILSEIEPYIESANGVGTITATVYGTPDVPKLTGVGELGGVSLKIVGSPVSLQNTSAEFELSESNLQIESVRGILNDGNLTAYGYVDSEWFKVNSIDLNVSLEKCNFVEAGQYEAVVSTGADDLHLFGLVDKSTQTNLTLTGDIIVHSGNYQQNWENVQNWFSGATVSQVELTFGNTILNNLQLDVDIDIPDHFSFLSSLGGSTAIKIKTNGHLTGLIQEPIYVGDVTILEGRISTFTQVFDIVKGSSIRNQNRREFNPDINIVLKLPNPIRGVLLEDGSTTDVMVSVRITGTLKNNKPTFVPVLLNSSTTEILSEADVLALLLPGSSISRSIGGLTITISSGFDPEERHIIAEYPFPNNMSIKVEGDEKGNFGVDIQLLERRF